jgi:alkanesulfonate monooxygenase SsuD/methylene tetrahydromethanopterin reductase-like flavin-dependent oxidoreductase (luciferase family)
MVGSSGERVLEITVPHAQSWNTWFDLIGNAPEGFAAASAAVTDVARRAGRDPAEIERSACALVVLDRSAAGRTIPDEYPPIEGPPDRLARGIRSFADAGADEVILVVHPITEASIRALAPTLASLED